MERNTSILDITRDNTAALGLLVTKAGLAMYEGAEAVDALKEDWRQKGFEPEVIEAIFHKTRTEELR